MAIKKEYKIFLTDTSYRKLLKKAKALGFEGRGCLSHLIERMATNEFIFTDKKSLTNMMKVMGKL